MAVSAIGLSLAYLSHVLFAKWLGVEQYGYYIYALAWAGVLTTFVQLGMNTSTVRLIAELRAEKKSGEIRGVSKFSTLIVLCAWGVCVVATLGVFVLEPGLVPRGQEIVLGIMLPIVATLGLLNQRMSILQGYERVAESMIFQEIVRPTIMICGVAGILFFSNINAEIVVGVNLMATAIALFLAIISTRRHFKAEGIERVKAAYEVRRWLMVSLPYFFIGMMTIAMDMGDLLILGGMLGGKAVGLYAPAAKLSQLILFPMLAIRSRVAPLLSRLYMAQSHAEVQRQLNIVTIFSGLTGGLLSALLVLQSETLLGLFGPEFIEAQSAVMVLAVGMFAFSLTGGVEIFLIMGPFERITILIYAVIVTINVVLNLILIPYFGYIGSAYASTATIIARGMISTFVVWRRSGILPWARVSTHSKSMETM